MSDALHDSANKAVTEMVAGPSKEPFLTLAPLAELLAVVAAMKSPINQDCYIYADEEPPLREGKQ
jgi:hypothetical protein